jgi:hypothetical protein
MGDKVLKTKFANKGCHAPTPFALLSIVNGIKEGSARSESASFKKHLFGSNKNSPSGFVFFVLPAWLILRGQSL